MVPRVRRIKDGGLSVKGSWSMDAAGVERSAADLVEAADDKVAPFGGRWSAEDSSHSLIWTSWALLAALLVIPVLLFGGASMEFWRPMFTGRVLIIVYSSLMLSALVRAPEARWFGTAFWSFCYVWMGLSALGQDTVGRAPYGEFIQQGSEIASAELVLIGMVAWHAGYLWQSRLRRLRLKMRDSPAMSPQRVAVVCLFAVAATPVLLVRQGGLLSNWSSRVDLEQNLTQAGLLATGNTSGVGGLVVGLALVLPFFAVLVLLRHFQQSPTDLRRPAWLALTVLVLAVAGMATSPMGNSRFWFGTVIIGVVTSLRSAHTKSGRAAVVIGVLVALVVVFPYADLYRRDNTTLQLQAISAPLEQKLDYDAASQVTNGMHARDDLGLRTNGRQLLGAALILVPRAIWSGKPDATGTIIAEANGFYFTHMSSPLWIEGYIDFGLLGTVGLLFAAGSLSGYVDRRYWHEFRLARGAPSLLQILVPPVAAYSYIILRGSLIGTLPDGVLLVLFGFLVVPLRGSTARARRAPRTAERSEPLAIERLR